MQTHTPNTVSIRGTYWTAPDTADQYPICLNDAGSVTICPNGDCFIKDRGTPNVKQYSIRLYSGRLSLDGRLSTS